MIRPLAFAWLFSGFCALSACASHKNDGAPSASASLTVPPSASSGALRSDTAQMAKDAMACKFENGVFDATCPAVSKWISTYREAKRDDDQGLFAMLLDTDEKTRVLAAQRPLPPESKVFLDKANAERLFDSIDNESNTLVRGVMTGMIGHFDLEGFGLQDKTRALSKSKVVATRVSLASTLTATPTPFRVEVLGAMLGDSDTMVRATASVSLGATAARVGDQSPMALQVCQLLKDGLAGANANDIMGAASRLHSCDGIAQTVLQVIDDKTKKPASLGDESFLYAMVLKTLCVTHPQPPDTKKKAFDLAKRLVQSDKARTRLRVMDTLATCDAEGAKAELQKLIADKDETVATAAKTRLATLTAPKK